MALSIRAIVLADGYFVAGNVRSRGRYCANVER